MLNSFFSVCERCLLLDVVRCWVMGYVSYLYFVYDIIIIIKMVYGRNVHRYLVCSMLLIVPAVIV